MSLLIGFLFGTKTIGIIPNTFEEHKGFGNFGLRIAVPRQGREVPNWEGSL